MIDTATNTVTATVTVGDGPFGVAATPDGSRVYVANFTSGTVSVIDTATNAVVATVTVEDGTQGVVVTPEGSRVYVTNRSAATVSVIDTATNLVTATVTVGGSPSGIDVSPDGSRVYLANSFSGTVSVIDTATNAVVATVAVGNSPRGVAVMPDGSRVYVANSNSRTVSVIDTSNNMVVATVQVGSGPAAFGDFISPGPGLPVPMIAQLLFGQVAIGSQGDLEIQSVISATNSGSVTYEGDFSFFTGDGTVWNPLVDGVEISNGQHSISILPFETISLTLSGAEIESGSAILRGTGPPDTAIDGNLTYFFVTAGALTDSIGVGPSTEIYRSTIPFQDFSTIALALANQDPTTKDVMLKLRQADGTLQETKNVQLAGNAHDARFLDQIFETTTVAGKTLAGGRVDIESNELIFGTAVTFLDGQISTLPLQPTRIEYDFLATDSEPGEEVVTGKMTLWADGNFVRGYLEVRVEEGVPLENPELIPIAGNLNNGVLRVTFAVDEDEELGLGAFVGIDFSFDQEVVLTSFVVVDLDEGESTGGTILFTKVAVP